MYKKVSTDQNGRSMIEAIGYISILIMVSVSVAMAVNSGYFKYRQSRINQQLTDLKQVISHRYVAAENYKDVKLQTLIDEKIAPHDIVVSGNKDVGRHAFSGNVKIGPGDTYGSTFVITFENLPRLVCNELGMKIWVVNDGSDLDYLKINNTTFAWKYSQKKDAAKMLPATATDVSDACNSEYENVMSWYFD